MAERRMIAKSISISEQVAALRDDFTRLLFTWLIAHADDYGVVTGAPAKVRALVVPLLEHVTLAQVKDALSDMEQHELIYRYADYDGAPLIQFATWEKHQFGLHKRTAPKHRLHNAPVENPGTTGDDVASSDTSRNFPELPGDSGSRGRARGTRHRRELEEKENLNGNLSASDIHLTSKKSDDDEKTADAGNAEPDIAAVADLRFQRFVRDVLHTFHIDSPGEKSLTDYAAVLHEFYCRSPDRTRAEAIKIADWLSDPQRNRNKKRLNITLLHNWLVRAFTPQPPSPGTDRTEDTHNGNSHGTDRRSAEQKQALADAEETRRREAGRRKRAIGEELAAQFAGSDVPGHLSRQVS